MYETLFNPAELRRGGRLERLAWLLTRLLGVPPAVAFARMPRAPCKAG